jgi:CRISPR system Cascade subunit CasE
MIATMYRLSRRDIRELRVTDDYSIHRIVYDLFPRSDGTADGRGFLYADKGGDFESRIVLILSKRLPGEPAAGSTESREVTESFLMHEHYAFEVVMNPSRRDAASGKTIAVRGEEGIRDWFIGKAQGWGFIVDPDRLGVSQIGVQRFEHKSDGMVLHNRATLSGVLEVRDRNAFKESFENGIGRSRGFGFGLLQLRPLDRAGVRA